MASKKTPRRGEPREAFGVVLLGGERSEGNQPRLIQQGLQRQTGALLAAVHALKAQRLRIEAGAQDERRAEALNVFAANLDRIAAAQRLQVQS